MSNALGNLFQDIADAIKEKTGNAATMKPAEFADNIRAIEISGGSSADVRYVTFMSHDGTVEYGKKAVAVGDDCADPIARGLFDTPTRESTVQYDYTFNGWASTINGSASSTVLNAVTADKTVYAAYRRDVRSYTARFYDGSTLLGSYTVAYGTKATPPDTSKAGYTFTGWTPADLTIYGDTDFYGAWEAVTGYSFVAKITDFDNTSISGYAVNNAGNVLAVVAQAAVANPALWDISGETPVKIENASASVESAASIDYNADNSKLHVQLRSGAYGGNSYYDVSNNYALANYTKYTVAANFGVCSSPVDAAWAWGMNYYPSTSSPSVRRVQLIKADGTTKSITLSANAKQMIYSQDGAYLACACYTTGVVIYDAATGDKLRTIATASAAWATSFSADGSKLVVCTAGAPYIEVYSISNGSKICDFADWVTATGGAAFTTGTNDLVVGSGATVKVYDFSGTSPVEIEEVPTYSGAAVTGIKSNHSGTRVIIADDTNDTIEIWGR